MNEVITTAVIGFISTIVGYIAGNRKTKAEANRIEIDNVKEVISVYTSAINDLKLEVKELKEQLEKYQTHIEKLEKELYSFRSQMNPSKRNKVL
jgi:predicted RNase H-like nuclease (RuvC/YqgF family)